jgi:hypothetical protein
VMCGTGISNTVVTVPGSGGDIISNSTTVLTCNHKT